MSFKLMNINFVSRNSNHAHTNPGKPPQVVDEELDLGIPNSRDQGLTKQQLMLSSCSSRATLGEDGVSKRLSR